MGTKTNIGWCDKTWNPWMGCHKVSQGCWNCYMFAEQKRYGQDPNVVRRSKTTFNAPLKWAESAYVFTCSWSDWFVAEADEWRDEAWAIIKATPHLTYQILTKRPERIAAHLPADWGASGYPNVWFGTSTERQAEADKRIPFLLQVPAALHFVSAEPLLERLSLNHYLANAPRAATVGNYDSYLDWVIVGGESGPKFRPMAPAWAWDIYAQCAAAGVAFFGKQAAAYANETPLLIEGRTIHQMPQGQRS